MAIASFLHNGMSVDYTPTAAVDAGAIVIQGSLVGVAPRDIAANELGSLQVFGVFEVAKAAVAFTAGASVYYVAANSNVTTTATGNTLIGVAVAAAASGDATVKVKIG